MMKLNKFNDETLLFSFVPAIRTHPNITRKLECVYILYIQRPSYDVVVPVQSKLPTDVEVQ